MDTTVSQTPIGYNVPETIRTVVSQPSKVSHRVKSAFLIRPVTRMLGTERRDGHRTEGHTTVVFILVRLRRQLLPNCRVKFPHGTGQGERSGFVAKPP